MGRNVAPTVIDPLPAGAILLAVDDDGRAYLVLASRALVIERAYAGRCIEARLPADLEWLWQWMEMATAACDQLASLST
jgi:hypothetical protein